MQPFTIQTFFPTGDPSGFRVTEITRDSLQAYYIPRNNLKMALEKRPELAWNGVYTLFDGSNATKAYIGEAENIGNRLKQHDNRQEKWWKIAVAFVINNQAHQLSKADIKFLENLMYSTAQTAKQMPLINANTPHKSFVNESRKYDLKSNFTSIDILLRSLGFPLFVKPESSKAKVPSNLDNDELMLYLNSRGSNATGIYHPHDQTITVLTGSRITNLEPTTSFTMKNLLAELTQADVIQNDCFTSDYQFSSTSTAANIITKGSYSGPQIWRDQHHHPLRKLESSNFSKPSIKVSQSNLFHLKARGAHAHAFYDFKTKKTTILKGSQLATKAALSFKQTNLIKKLTQQHIIVNNVFTADYVFSSPSTAATIVCKASMSGPRTWLNNDGICLKDLINH